MDLTAAASSAYELIRSLNSAITTTVGLDVLWCRAVPPEKAEDVILNEYSLLNVECPKPLRVVTQKADYQPGNFNVDVFGISYEAPWEIAIDISAWKAVYGLDTMPQKGDIVYIKMVHKLFEVVSSTINYTVAELPTSFKVQLSKYNPSQSRKENPDLKKSIDDLTVSQEELFGDKISDEVADIVDPVITDFNHSTQVDPYKTNKLEFLDSVIKQQELKLNGNIISQTHYEFKNAKEALVYNRKADYSASSKRNFWVFCCWFKVGAQMDFDVYLKNVKKLPKSWTLDISSTYDFSNGEEIQISRGTNLSVNGKIIVDKAGNAKFQVPIKEVFVVNKKILGWEKLSGWKLKSNKRSTLLSGYNDSKKVFDIYLKGNSLFLNSSSEMQISLPSSYDIKKWNFLSVVMSPTEDHVYLLERTSNGRAKEVFETSMQDSRSNFSIDKFEIDNTLNDFNMMNIHLYENEYDLTSKEFKLEAQNKYSRNASKTIITDDPNIPNLQEYKGQAK